MHTLQSICPRFVSASFLKNVSQWCRNVVSLAVNIDDCPVSIENDFFVFLSFDFNLNSSFANKLNKKFGLGDPANLSDISSDFETK